LICLAREGEVEQIHFFLVQHTAESCSISKSLGDVIRLLVDIQKKWLESCLKNHWVFNIKFDGHCRFQLIAKEFS